MKKKAYRMGNPAEIGKLDYHSFLGKVEDRIKWKVGEKQKAVMAIDRIIMREGLSEEQIKHIREELRAKEKSDFEELVANAKRKPFAPSGFKKVRY